MCACPLPPSLYITLQLAAASRFVSLLMEAKKTPWEIIDALKWMFVQGYLCPGEKRPVFAPLAPLEGCAAPISSLLPL